ncbi:MAG: hemerythrin domain-containing protein [bacterium]|nr:hemerythrin domain-containing protein [bacterium]
MSEQVLSNRRYFIHASASTAAGLILITKPQTIQAQDEHKEEDVSPAEDLMREHGVLKRVMLIYEEIISRLDGGKDFSPDSLRESAHIIRTFIEDYHEKLEEDFLFPRFRDANVLADLCDVLVKQHQAGRVLTDRTLQLSTLSSLKNEDDRRELSQALRQFIRMYSPHEAREDTVLFPAFRGIVSENEYDSLGEDFEDKEHDLFGEDGFDGMVDKVAEIEKTMGLYDLAQFTPLV